MKLDFNMFRLVMRYWVLWEIHTILVIIMNHSGIQHIPKQSCKDLLKTHYFVYFHTYCNILVFTILKATIVCFMLHQKIMEEPKLKKHPEVLFLSITLPAQSESTYPCNLMSVLEAYLRAYPIVPRKYLKTFFASTHCICFFWLVNWLSALLVRKVGVLISP